MAIEIRGEDLQIHEYTAGSFEAVCWMLATESKNVLQKNPEIFPFDRMIGSTLAHHLLEDGQKVLRYGGSPLETHGLLQTVADHTQDFVSRTMQLPLPLSTRMFISTKAAIHDIPEILLQIQRGSDRDMPDGLKIANPAAAAAEALAEDEIAREIFTNPTLLTLYEAFEVGTDFNIKPGLADAQRAALIDTPLKALGVLASVIDKVDGNQYYHRNITKLIASGIVLPEEFSSFSFARHHAISNRLALLADREDLGEVITIAQTVLDKSTQHIIQMWHGLDPELVPTGIKANIEEFYNYNGNGHH